MRFDHAVIGVADLEQAIDAYRALGFAVRVGGRHTGEGTHNAIVRFGLDYLELMAVHDEDLARSRPFGSQLLALLARGEGGLIGYVVAAADLDLLAQRMRHTGLDPSGPIAMQRERPDGRALKWRLLFPRGQRWRDLAPFVIEWGTSDAARIAWDAPEPQPNGVTGVAGLVVRVDDVSAAAGLYRSALGLAVTAVSPRHARAALGDVPVDLVAGDAPSADDGVSPRGLLVELTLRVAEIGSAARAISGLDRDADGLRYRIPRAAALGAVLALVEVSGSGS